MTMTEEIYWLVLTSGLTAALSLVYVLNVIVRQYPKEYPITGIFRILVFPPLPGEDRFQWEWGFRAERAHLNAIENLVAFAPLVLAVQITGTNNEMTAMACQIYFWARLVHAPGLIFKIPTVRTIAWMVGLGATFVLFYQLVA